MFESLGHLTGFFSANTNRPTPSMEIIKWLYWFESQCNFCLLDIKNSSVWTFWNFKKQEIQDGWTVFESLSTSRKSSDANEDYRLWHVSLRMQSTSFYALELNTLTWITHVLFMWNAVALFAGLILNLNLITFWSVKVALAFLVRFYVLP